MPLGYRLDGVYHPDFFCTLARDQWLYAGGNGWTSRTHTLSVFVLQLPATKKEKKKIMTETSLIDIIE